ncbi:MAG TPA: phage holin family protein, partial [Pseudomonas sp.]|nr:phage holin family protein [Pseudomonas sp.]
CLTAMAGADVAIGLYERWAARRLGVDAQDTDFHKQGNKE